MKQVLYISSFLVLILVSCGKKEDEVISLNDIIQGSERYKEDTMSVDHQTKEVVDTMLLFLNDFKSNGIEVNQLITFDEKFFPDRLGPIKTDKFELKRIDNTFRFVQWKFKDSAKVINAFFNWMDCFGKKCNSIFIGEERVFQTNPFQLLVNDSTLIFVEGIETFDFKEWENYFEQKGFPLDWNYVIEQRKRGKAHWFNYIEEKKTPLKK